MKMQRKNMQYGNFDKKLFVPAKIWDHKNTTEGGGQNQPSYRATNSHATLFIPFLSVWTDKMSNTGFIDVK